MIDYKDKITDILAPVIEELDKETIRAMIEVPSDRSNGDYAFPCFRLAKVLHKAPQAIAADIAAQIGGHEIFEKVEQVNAYVNMYLHRAAFARAVLSDILKDPAHVGHGQQEETHPVIVEYSSPNIAKPFHIGHIRSTVIGNSINNIYDFLGYEGDPDQSFGDYGTQFGKMIVAYRHWGNKEDVIKEPIKTLLGYYTKFHEEAEKDPSLEDEARATFTKLETARRKR